jgi:5-methylcytosine-specific restriction endonuclease McrA
MTQRPGTVRRQVAILRERYGDNCWLCALPIDFAITDANDPMRYSRDHVVPRVLGGGSTVANMRLAHRQCNSRRGPRTPLMTRLGGLPGQADR